MHQKNMSELSQQIIWIELELYHKLIGYNEKTVYRFADKFDKSCGLKYTPSDHIHNGVVPEKSFSFVIVNEKKYLLAKIKYGI